MSTHIQHVREEIRTLLRGKGMRVTSPRMAVLVELHERATPMTHEQIFDVLPDGVYDKATVWRLLSDLTDSGVLRRMDLGDRVWRYEMIDACRPVQDDHAHFLCEDCGAVSCLPPLEIHAQDGPLPAALLGANYRIRITGSCSECRLSEG